MSLYSVVGSLGCDVIPLNLPPLQPSLGQQPGCLPKTFLLIRIMNGETRLLAPVLGGGKQAMREATELCHVCNSASPSALYGARAECFEGSGPRVYGARETCLNLSTYVGALLPARERPQGMQGLWVPVAQESAPSSRGRVSGSWEGAPQDHILSVETYSYPNTGEPRLD